MRSAWAGDLHLRSRADGSTRAGGNEVNTLKQSAVIHDGYEREADATPGFSAKQPTGGCRAGDQLLAAMQERRPVAGACSDCYIR